ncbi:hypothetical protein [Muriicola sp. Z0-33]|uniref:hypothetical protein n=1 Tax=Muriicola sp. Z0-33 TaxID=2816957 RepID=UPI0022390AD6|nr:hypothetical protein [Muriicola sp. Z0-33]MCW5515466.1 hypothetical protein [Muriicola sp. Z0-33]
MKPTNNFFAIIIFSVAIIFASCSNDDNDTMAQVRVNGSVLFDNGDDFNGDVDGDFTGNGGSASRTFIWLNNLSRADYNADITATAEGTFNILVLDADGNSVLNRSLNGATEPDSFSGVTDRGTSGVWSVTITLESFNGDGSFSMSEGD